MRRLSLDVVVGFLVASAALLAGPAAAAATPTTEDTGEYDYIVVGGGIGGGTVAVRLALAGHRTLLLEAGEDHGDSLNYTVPVYSSRAAEDPAMAWNFFVRHYASDGRQARDAKTSYRTRDGGLYTGLQPPAGAAMLGTLYPRSATLGGCSAHNALVAVYPHRSDWDAIAEQTGDESWRHDRMRRYLVRLEDNLARPLDASHGHGGWQPVEQAPLAPALGDAQLVSLIFGGAYALGNATLAASNVASLLVGDVNADSEDRDRNGGYFQTQITARDGRRVAVRDWIVETRDARNPDGSKRYPLHVKTGHHVTKVLFDRSGPRPRATGVEYLKGEYLYRASPRSGGARRGPRGTFTARHEVIVAGGAYNSPQLLKLSGVGPADELARHGIPLVRDVPGVGTNLQDHYEVAVQARTPHDFKALDGCTFSDDDARDPCLARWRRSEPITGRGVYASNGFFVSSLYRSAVADEYDIFAFGATGDFRGYFPNFSVQLTQRHDVFSWTVLKSHPRNRAGSVTLTSADPLEPPRIVFNYFDTGSGDAAKDLRAIREGITIARDAFRRQFVPTKEVLPGADVRGDAALDQYIKDTAWGHHASSTCPMGADGDRLAVLDSSFRVRGVDGLRVVDASVFPRIPGAFPVVAVAMVGEKAADVILQQRKDGYS